MKKITSFGFFTIFILTSNLLFAQAPPPPPPSAVPFDGGFSIIAGAALLVGIKKIYHARGK